MYRREGKLRKGICPGWKNDGRVNVWGGKMTGENMSWVEKRLGKYVLGVKMTGGNMSGKGIFSTHILELIVIATKTKLTAFLARKT